MEAEQTVFSFVVGGKELIADIEIGEVLEIQSHSETRVFGSGGGGRIDTDSYNKISGTISSVEISSHVINKTKVWVKTSNNLEDEWVFNVDVTELSIRKGHKIGKYNIFNSETDDKGGHNGIYRKFINFTTGKTLEISSSEYALEALGLINKISWGGEYPIMGLFIGLAISILLIYVEVAIMLAIMSLFVAVMGGIALGFERKSKEVAINEATAKEFEVMDDKVMELIASNKIPTAVAYFKSKKEQKS